MEKASEDGVPFMLWRWTMSLPEIVRKTPID